MQASSRARTRRPRGRSTGSLDPPQAKTGPAASGSASARTLRSDLIAIGLIAAGILLGLALIRHGSGGWVSALCLSIIRFWMGHFVLVAPVLLIGAGISLAFDHRRTWNLQLGLGVSGILATLFGWVHLVATPSAQAWASTGARLKALAGWPHDPDLVLRADGGLLGGVMMSLLAPFGTSGPYVALAAIGAISLLLVTQLTIRGIAERIRQRSSHAAQRAKRGAEVVKARYQEGVAARAERREQRRTQALFLELGDGKEGGTASATSDLAAPPERPRSVLFPSAPRDPAAPNLAPPAETRAPSAARTAPTELEQTAGTSPRVARGRVRPSRPVPSTSDGAEYVFPPLDLLDSPVARPRRAATEAEANISILENTLAQFRIQAQVVEIADGPSITRYEIRLGEGIRVKKILDLADNIAMSLAAMSVRVEAPIPGKAAIGIEVPKKQAALVTMRECLESDEASALASRVGFVLGKDVGGNVRCADLARMPHLLVAGATNSGKSVCLNVLIASLLFRARPDELKLIMIDPKRVELTLFDGIPHLIHPVVKDVKQAAGILRWVLKEMDRRYDLFTRLMTRNVENYNEKVSRDPATAHQRLPFLVVVIDELADLMMQQGPEIEQSICRLAQLSRATGIHLVIATQRPSVDVITGLIKANVPSRIAFAVSSQIDSRTILDGKGAESLIGRGDMLFKPVDAAKPIRIQGAFLREQEVEALVKHLKTQGRPEYLAEALSVDHGTHGIESPEDVDDELFEPAARFIVTTGHASTSMLQRKFKIGYTRAARLVDLMETRGIVGALDGARPREILMSREAVDSMFSRTRNSLFRATGLDLPDDDDEDEDASDDLGEASGPDVDEDVIMLEETITTTSDGRDPFADD